MAGIGFALRRLARRDDLIGAVLGYGHAAMVSAGPWMFTILALSGINLMHRQVTDQRTLILFSSVIVYNFAFTLVISGPVIMVATRYLADRIYSKDVSGTSGLLLFCLALVFGLSLPFVLPFYGVWADLSPGLRLAAIGNFLVIAGVWVVTVFLTALKDYRTVTLTFAAGMATAFAAALLLAGRFGAAGMVCGLSIGMGLILFVLIAKVFAEYRHPVIWPVGFLGYFGRYWELALSGLVYNSAIWIDKWIMWFAPESQVFGGAFRTYPEYDGAMFLAYLSIVPALALFTLSIETGFFEQYQNFYKDIQQHANFDRIRRNHQGIVRTMLDQSRRMFVLQGSIAAIIVLLAPQIIASVGSSFLQVGMFRFGVLGATFHVFLLFASVALSYFDLRRLNLCLQSLFLALNGGLTAVTLELGFPFYGYGYFLAALISFLAGYAMVATRVRQLPYLTFVANNPSVR